MAAAAAGITTAAGAAASAADLRMAVAAKEAIWEM